MFRTRNIYPENNPLPKELPPAYMNNAMPSRPPRHGMRNLTGLYLGVEGERTVQPVRHAVPVGARGRGMPSQRIQTPTEKRRYRKLELLRTKENQRGFSGNPLKRRPGVPVTEMDDAYLKHYQQPEPLTFWDLTRQTQRNFTAANNAGVTHLEYLRPAASPNQVSAEEAAAWEDALHETVTREIHRASTMSPGEQTAADMSGLVECYKKICRNNQDTLNTLLPMRKMAQENRVPSHYSPTGFCVKSYRKPAQAEIMATFPNPTTRSKTVLGITQRAYVPSPYFFKGYNAPATSMDRYNRSYTPYSEGADPHKRRDVKSAVSNQLIIGLPSTGHGSRQVSHGHGTTHNTTPRVANTPIDQLSKASKPGSAASSKRQGSPTSERENSIKDNVEHLSVSIPAAEDTQSNSQNDNQNQEAPSETPETEIKSEPEASGDGAEVTEAADMMDHVSNHISGSKLEKTPSGSEIIIDLENEKGERKPVDIDDTDDQLEDEVASNGSIRRKVSITGRVLKSKNSAEQAAQLHQEAENRKKQLEDLLDEHAQIVHEVEVAIESESTAEENTEITNGPLTTTTTTTTDEDKENKENSALPLAAES